MRIIKKIQKIKVTLKTFILNEYFTVNFPFFFKF